jgi:hypothetical protein
MFKGVPESAESWFTAHVQAGMLLLKMRQVYRKNRYDAIAARSCRSFSSFYLPEPLQLNREFRILCLFNADK